jgi:Rrf2 family protein
MNFSKSIRYALYAAMEMALRENQPVTVGEVAERYEIPEGALAKVFQQLVRSGIAIGIRGIGGGYRLARAPGRVTVQEIVGAFEAPRPEGLCLLADGVRKSCPKFPDCRLSRLFAEVDDLVRGTFESVSLETLARGPALKMGPLFP